MHYVTHACDSVIHTGVGEITSVRILKWRNLVQKKFGITSSIPLQNLIQNSQIVAQEQAPAVDVGGYFLWDFSWLLLFLCSWLLDGCCIVLPASGCLLLFGPSNIVA